MSTPRLLWITERYPPAKGGMAVSCARQASGLRKRGLAVDVLAFESGVDDVEITPRDGGDDIRLPADPAPGVAPNLAWATIAPRHAARPYSHLIGFGASWPGFVAATFGAWLDAAAVVLVRGNDFDRDWYLPRHGEWLRFALQRASAIGAVSPEKVERIRALYPDRRALWTPNGVDVERWRLLPAEERRRDELRSLSGAPGRRVVGLFGDLKFKKRVPLWLEAVRDDELLDEVGLLVVGTLDEETALLLEDPAVAPRSVRLPFAPVDELPALYSACDFLAIPSSFEGMPNVLLEAMACGVIPIVSDAGAMSTVVRDGETGFVFAAENRRAAGDATARALALTADERRAFSERVRKYVAREFPVHRELDSICELLALCHA